MGTLIASLRNMHESCAAHTRQTPSIDFQYFKNTAVMKINRFLQTAPPPPHPCTPYLGCRLFQLFSLDSRVGIVAFTCMCSKYCPPGLYTKCLPEGGDGVIHLQVFKVLPLKIFHKMLSPRVGDLLLSIVTLPVSQVGLGFQN